MILSASARGLPFDQKWGLEVAGVVPERLLLWMLRDALGSASQWLKEVAYRQVSRLEKIPIDVAEWIRESLVGMATQGRLPREHYSTLAYLSRLDKSQNFLEAMQLLLWARTFDQALHVVVFLFLMFGFISSLVKGEILFSLIFYPVIMLAIFLSYISLWRYQPFTRLERLLQNGYFRFVVRGIFAVCIFFILPSLLPWIYAILFPRELSSQKGATNVGSQPIDQLLAGVVLFIVPVYLASWALFVPGAVSIGRFMKTPMWPLIPFSPILNFFSNLITVPRLLVHRMLEVLSEIRPRQLANWTLVLILFGVGILGLNALGFGIILNSQGVRITYPYVLTDDVGWAVLLSITFASLCIVPLVRFLTFPRRHSMIYSILSRYPIIIALLIVPFTGLLYPLVVMFFSVIEDAYPWPILITMLTLQIQVSVRLAIVLIIWGMLFSIFIIPREFRSWLGRLQDWNRWREWNNLHSSQIDPKTFVESIIHYRDTTYCARVVKLVREHNLLIASSISEQMLKDIIQIVSMRRNAIFKREYLRALDSSFDKQWYSGFAKKRKWRLFSSGPEFTDELCRLLEQVRASREISGIG